MIHKTIKEQIIIALRARDALKLETLRGLNAMFQNEMISKGLVTDFLPDNESMPLVKRAVKQRKDSIEQFEKGGRNDLAAKEKAELVILESYLPASMPKEDIRKIAKQKLMELHAAGTLDAKSGGKVTGILMKELAGKADGADVKAVVDELLKGGTQSA